MLCNTIAESYDLLMYHGKIIYSYAFLSCFIEWGMYCTVEQIPNIPEVDLSDFLLIWGVRSSNCTCKMPNSLTLWYYIFVCFFIDAPQTLPKESDYLLAHCTSLGFIGLRLANGSCFIRALYNAFQKHNGDYQLTDLLTVVNCGIARLDFERDGKVYKQQPSFYSVLRKRVCLYPGK